MKTKEITEADLPQFIAELLPHLMSETGPQTAILVLKGDLGAGKTTFTIALAAILGVTDTVTSPTFVVLRTYRTNHPTWSQLVHIDAYRIETEAELGPLQFSTYCDTPHTIVCIEWPERLGTALPVPHHELSFETLDPQTRSITYRYVS